MGRLAETQKEDGATHLRLRGPSGLCTNAHACTRTTAHTHTHAHTHAHTRLCARACVCTRSCACDEMVGLAGHVDGAGDTSASSVGARHPLRVRRHNMAANHHGNATMQHAAIPAIPQQNNAACNDASGAPVRPLERRAFPSCAHWSGGLAFPGAVQLLGQLRATSHGCIGWLCTQRKHAARNSHGCT